MRLSAIHLRNVRTFDGEHRVELHPKFTVLVGKNNSGKSTLLRVPVVVGHGFHFASTGTTARAEKFFHPFTRHGAPKDTAFVSLVFTAKSKHLYETLGCAITRENYWGQASTGPLGDGKPVSAFDWSQDWFNPEAIIEFELGVQLNSPEYAPTAFPRVFFRLNASDRPPNEAMGGHWYAWEWTHHGPNGVQCRAGGFDSPESRVAGYQASTQAPVDQLRALAKFVVKTCACWGHQVWASNDEWGQNRRRIRDAGNEIDNVVHWLHSSQNTEFGMKPVDNAIRRAFPEIRALHFRFGVGERSKDAQPVFELATAQNPTDEELRIDRESLGNGCWSYLSILVATRVAALTDARTMFLDEPHLFLHPGLERLLIGELIDASAWSEPLQLVVATHSPAFISAALRLGSVVTIDWNKAHRESVTRSQRSNQIADELASELPLAYASLVDRAGDLFLYDNVIFCEGRSDQRAIELLWRATPLTSRFPFIQPLSGPDDCLKKDVIRAIPKLALHGKLGLLDRPVLVLDADKKVDAERSWKGLIGENDPRRVMKVVFVGREGNDFESIFVDQGFLEKFFDDERGEKLVTPADIDCLVSEVASMKVGKRVSAKEKGGAILERLYQKLVPESKATTKEDRLERLVRFFLTHKHKNFCKTVQMNLRELMGAVGFPDADEG